MKRRLCFIFGCLLALTLAAPAVSAQENSSPASEKSSAPAPAPEKHGSDASAANNNAAAAVVAGHAPPRSPDFLEELVDAILALFNVRTSGNTTAHYVISALLLVGAFLLRHVVTNFVFGFLKKFAARTKTTLDDKLFPALEAPVATFITLTGIFAALTVLKLPATSDAYLRYGSTIAFSLVLFWFLLRAFDALLDHAHEVARDRQMGVAAFMPWIKKTLVSIFVVFGVLMVVQSLGYDVKALLAGLGIGGLAFALAAQDTLANVFGSVVVAVDQPFKIGEVVRIGAFVGGVEDIGLRSTKLRSVDKSLVVIPNKTVASETITNLSRFTQRRAEQVISLTYDTTTEQMESIVEDFRRILVGDDYVDPASVLVYFRDFAASSLDVWIVYLTKDGDFQRHMRTRQKLNLAFMRAVEARGLSFAFPTQTLQHEGEFVQRLVERSAGQAPSIQRLPVTLDADGHRHDEKQ